MAKSTAAANTTESEKESPSYESSLSDRKTTRSRPRIHPANWGQTVWLCLGIGFAIAVGVGIIVAVIEVKKTAYPKYVTLSYSLQDTYSGSSFFDNFDYWSAADPANGFVIYVDESNSTHLNLTHATDESAILRVDTAADFDNSNGRRSVRIASKQTYNTGLFIFDVLHAPHGCGTWPALWLSDPYNWPAYGEIDVMESVNTAATGNQMALHTSDGCSMNVRRKETGAVDYPDCFHEMNENSGCGVKGPVASYGEAFNNNGGGVYAMEWRSAGIRMWFWNHSSTPSDIDISIPTNTTTTTTTNIQPDPSKWGTPLADFPSTHCDISTHFQNHSIIANIDLCGSWAGSSHWYSSVASCPGTSCNDYVRDNPDAFVDAYWEFRSFKVYTATSPPSSS